MGQERTAMGATGRTVAERVRHFREAQRLTYAELARRLQSIGRTIPVLGLSRIETLERRVDSDDLVALAEAFGVSPATLLMPAATSPDERIEVSGFDRPAARPFWRWLQAESPVADSDMPTVLAFRLRSGPGYQGMRLGSDAIPVGEIDEWWKGNDDDGDR